MFDIFGIKKEGPGVSPDTPRKTGFGRFFEIFTRDYGAFYSSGLISFIAFLPTTFGLILSVTSRNLFWAVVFGLVGGMIAAPFYTVLVDTILRAQRDEPGYWWVRYRKAFKNNWKASLLPGAIFGAVANIQALCIWVLLPENFNIAFIICSIISLIATSFLALWIFPQIALFDLPLWKIIRNAAIISLGQFPRSFGASLIIAVYWGAIILFSPLSFFAILFTTVWFPVFVGLSMIYVPLEKTFEIEKRVEEKRVEEATAAPRYNSTER